MRFAWLRENSPSYAPVNQGFADPLSIIRKVYNAVFWIFLLPFFTSIDYSTGFIAYTIIIGVRLLANCYTNNILKPSPEQFERYPLRIP
jgi:hypothetical protein